MYEAMLADKDSDNVPGSSSSKTDGDKVLLFSRLPGLSSSSLSASKANIGYKLTYHCMLTYVSM